MSYKKYGLCHHQPSVSWVLNEWALGFHRTELVLDELVCAISVYHVFEWAVLSAVDMKDDGSVCLNSIKETLSVSNLQVQ